MTTTATSHPYKTYTAIYREKGYTIRHIDPSLLAPHLFDKACQGQIINIHALYKHYVDDAYEFNRDVHQHVLTESMLDANTMIVRANLFNEDHVCIDDGCVILERIPLTFTIK